MTGPLRSIEEFAMRSAVERWGRPRWPDARLVHELVVGGVRIDMAFIGPDYLVGVEIKSSRDTLDRLPAQRETFSRMLPLTIYAFAQKWRGKSDVHPRIYIADGVVEEDFHDLSFNRAITSQMLFLLWASEMRAIAARMRVSCSSRASCNTIAIDLARALTGDEIVREVCRELRARDAFPRYAEHPASDPPIFEAVSP